MFVNYPQMPTGQLPSKELFEKLIAFGKTMTFLSFMIIPTVLFWMKIYELADIVGAKGLCDRIEFIEQVAIIMAGWRVGMLCGAKKELKSVRFKAIWTVECFYRFNWQQPKL